MQIFGSLIRLYLLSQTDQHLTYSATAEEWKKCAKQEKIVSKATKHDRICQYNLINLAWQVIAH